MKSKEVNKKDLFVSDSEVSQDQEVSNVSPQKNSPTQDLYEQNFQKYIAKIKEISQKIQESQQRCFGDGIWYVNHPLIQITQINYEKNQGIFDIIQMDQKNMYKKALVVFTYIDNEIQKIIQILQRNLYDSLVMYGEQSSDKKQWEKDLPQLMTSKILSTYKKIYELVKKLMAYIQNLIMQLHSIINKKSVLFKTNFKGLNYDYVIDLIGKALRSIYVIDCIVQNNINIEEHWQKYKKLIKLAKNQPEKFGLTGVKVKKLQKYCGRLQKTILSKECMKTITQITYDQIYQKSSNPLGKIKVNKQLRQYFELYFQRKLKQINQNFGATTQNDQQKKLLDLMCNYALYRKLYPSEQLKGIWKQLWAMQKKIPIIQAHSFVCVYVCVFMNQVCPLPKKPRSMDPPNQGAFLKTYLIKLEQTLGLQIVSYYTKFCVWLSRMQSVVTSNSSLRGLSNQKQKSSKIIQERLSNRIILLIEGFNMILKINKLLYLCFLLHSNQSKGIKLQLLGKLILGMETLKATSYIIRKKMEAFDLMVLTKTIAKDLLLIIEPIYQKLNAQQMTKKVKQNTERIQILKMIVFLLKGPISELKISLIKYGLGFIQEWAFREEQIIHIRKCVKKMQIIFYSQILVMKYQNCSYLYFCRQILTDVFQYKRLNPNTCKRLQFLFQCFQDPAYMIQNCVHLSNPQQLFLEFKKSIISKFESSYMVPLKRKIEDFLRISTHCMLIQKLEGVKPFQAQMTDLMKMVQFQKLRIFDTVVDIKFEISNSFNTSFYNLNILNMHDMQTYQQMRIMGNHIFGLKLHDTFLPSQTIQQGKFDILQIIRNIPQFIVTYKYNLLSQKFLEVTGQNKIISSIGIQQLSDSIRTHGLGILSTTVNAFYKFLVGKVQGFNKFLYNEHIKSLLTKQKKWFKQYAQGKDYPGYYPYQRAQQLYKQIKKLGKFQNQTNYLDKFRDIITSVGNSLGFIRLLRSASLNSCSKSIQYLPKKLQISQSFYDICSKTGLSQSTKECSKQFDQILNSLEDKFSDKIDYLNVMIKAFSKITSKQNKHLKLFYLIIPALTINYVQNISKGKQQISKKLSSKAFLYDDGFTLGLSYFINLLNQNEYYKTTHWQFAAQSYFDNAKIYSKETKDASNHSAKFMDDLNMQQQLLIKKLQIMAQQFVLFEYNMVSANVLFKGNSSKVKEQKKQVPTSPPSGQNS